jgi:hypothetical protein
MQAIEKGKAPRRHEVAKREVEQGFEEAFVHSVLQKWRSIMAL